MANVGTLNMQLLANATQFQATMRQATASLNSFQSRVGGFTSGIAAQLTGALGGFAAGGFFGWGVKIAADAEAAQAAFTVLAGSAEKARGLLADIKAMSQASPLSQPQMRDAATMLLQYGVAIEQVMPMIRQLGDVSLGNADKFSMAALALGQVFAAGKLRGEELRQLINIFNPLQEISRKTGESMTDLRDRMQAGGISAQEVADAFRTATESGGRFHGMLDSIAGTASGSFMKMKAAAANAAQAWGETLTPAVVAVAKVVEDAAKWFGSIDASTRSNVAQFVLWAASTAAVVYAMSRMVTAITAIIAALRAMATAQAIVQALSGPKGWAAIAASVLVAAGAIAAVSAMFDETSRKAAKAAEEAKKAAEAANMKPVADTAKEAATAFSDLAESIAKLEYQSTAIDAIANSLDDLMKRGAEVTKEMRTPAEAFADTASELRELFAVGAISGETFRRAMEDARKKTADARGDMEAIENMRKGVGAAVVGTREGFSAVQQALRDRDADRARKELLERGGGIDHGGDMAEVVAEEKRAADGIEGLVAFLESGKLSIMGADISFPVAEF